jgi:hypothetical protein
MPHIANMAMSLQPDSVAIDNKNNSDVEEVAHIEGNKVDLDIPEEKSNTGYQYVPFENSREKSPAERKLVWKIDLLLVPLLALIYWVSFLASFFTARRTVVDY